MKMRNKIKLLHTKNSKENKDNKNKIKWFQKIKVNIKNKSI